MGFALIYMKVGGNTSSLFSKLVITAVHSLINTDNAEATSYSLTSGKYGPR